MQEWLLCALRLHVRPVLGTRPLERPFLQHAIHAPVVLLSERWGLPGEIAAANPAVRDRPCLPTTGQVRLRRRLKAFHEIERVSLCRAECNSVQPYTPRARTKLE